MSGAQQLDWLELLESYRMDYLHVARHVALKLLETRETITINDVRAEAPPPKDIDPRVMGAVFRCKLFEGTGEYIRSNRSTCHHRPVQKFRLSA